MDEFTRTVTIDNLIVKRAQFVARMIEMQAKFGPSADRARETYRTIIQHIDEQLWELEGAAI